MAQGLFKIEGYPDLTQAVSGMAHFSGGGPGGATCRQCHHYGHRDHEKKCTKFREMTHDWGANIRPSQAACKYFTARST